LAFFQIVIVRVFWGMGNGEWHLVPSALLIQLLCTRGDFLSFVPWVFFERSCVLGNGEWGMTPRAFSPIDPTLFVFEFSLIVPKFWGVGNGVGASLFVGPACSLALLLSCTLLLWAPLTSTSLSFHNADVHSLGTFFFVLAENFGGADSKGEAVAEIEAVQSLFVLSCVLVSSGLLCCWA
jgi:hypothetical protein